MSLGIVYKNEL